MKSIEQELEELQASLIKIEEHQARENAFAELANVRFERNLEAFSKYYPDIADAINCYQVPEDFHLNVTKTGYGNIDDPDTGVAVYSDDPITQTKLQIERNIEKPYFTHTNYTGFAKAKLGQENIHAVYMRKLGHLLVEKKAAEQLETLPYYSPTAMIFGLGLGYHLELLLNEYRFENVFICEPKFELFFASLFCIDWAAIITKIDEQGGCLYIHLGVTYKEFFKDIWMISETVGAMSIVKSFCYQHYPSAELTSLIKDFQSRYFELQMGFGFYNDARTSIAHTILNTEKPTNYLQSKPKDFPYKDTPVYIVGNGPSLDKAAEYIKQTQENAIIFAAGTALTTLVRMGIKADFHVLTERPKTTFDVLQHSLDASEYKKLNLLTLNVIYPDVLDMYDWSGIALKPKEAGSDLHVVSKLLSGHASNLHLGYCGPLVSNTALTFAAGMGFENIYLFGVDNGTPSEGEHHAKHSLYFDESMKKSDKVKQHNFGRKIPGNFGGDVFTNKLLQMSKVQIERFLAQPSSKDIDCYNVGEGAYIEGAHPTRIDNLFPPASLNNKHDIIAYAKNTNFVNEQVSTIRETVEPNVFDDVCAHFIELASEPVNSREEAMDILRRQSRYLYSMRNTKISYIHFIIEGSLLYYHCPMLTALYSYNNEEESVQLYREISELWCEYLTAIKDDFPNSYLSKCDKNWAFLEKS